MGLDAEHGPLVMGLRAAFFAIAAAWLAACGAPDLARVGPEPGLSPVRVVELQLAALRAADSAESLDEIGVVFRFASPHNRAATGPLDRFAAMLAVGPYSGMLGHDRAEVGEVEVAGPHAIVPVVVTERGGERTRYVFVLTLQRGGECDGCWMTDAVTPADVLEEPDEERPLRI
jgi:hypothetical protein